jgi:hypothetical protein
VANVYLISEEMASLMKRSFKLNPFIQKSIATNAVMTNNTSTPSTPTITAPNDPTLTSSTPPFIIIVRRNELAKLYAHLNLLSLNDLEAFLYLCLPQFKKLDAKAQNNFLKYLYEEILEKSFMHERDKCFKMLRDKLYIHSRSGGSSGISEPRLISELYDTKSDALKFILDDSYFPDESFDSPQCLRFLKEAGLRTHLPSELCKKCMNEIETQVTQVSGGWTDELRQRSKWLYMHLVENWQKFDDSVLQQRFLEPYCPDKRYMQLMVPFEYSEFERTCLKLSDAELHKYESLVWSSSYILPVYVVEDNLDLNTLEFLKINRKPCFAIVNQHLTNVCETVGAKEFFTLSSANNENEESDDGSKKEEDSTTSKSSMHTEEVLVEVLGKVYQYLDNLSQSEHYKVN